MPPDSIALPGRTAPIIWRRSARARRISLRIDPRGGGVIVTLPARASVAAGRAVLQTHRDWVAERLDRLPAPVALGDGATIMLDGTPRRIVHRGEMRGTAWLEAGNIHVAGDPAFVGRRVGDWLRAQARKQLGQLAREKAERGRAGGATGDDQGYVEPVGELHGEWDGDVLVAARDGAARGAGLCGGA